MLPSAFDIVQIQVPVQVRLTLHQVEMPGNFIKIAENLIILTSPTINGG